MIDILLIAIIAIIIGANDASNVFGSAVGSKMLKFKLSVVLFIIFIISLLFLGFMMYYYDYCIIKKKIFAIIVKM